MYQILGAHVKKNGKRYYRVKDNLDIGYFYAGTKQDHKKWAKRVWSEINNGKKLVALPGDSIKVKRKIWSDSF